MGIFSDLMTRLTTSGSKRRSLEELRAIGLAFAEDGIFSDDELQILEERRDELGLTPEDMAAVYQEIFLATADAAKADRRLTPEEDASLRRLAGKWNIQTGDHPGSSAQLARMRTLHMIEQGFVPAIDPGSLILKRGEVAHWQEYGAILEEKVVSRGYVGGSSGFSVRICRGVSYHVGSTRGQMVSRTEQVPVSRGTLTLTNQRLVFAGDRKSAAAPWHKLVECNLYSDGIRFLAEGKSKPTLVVLDGRDAGEIVGLLASRLLNAQGAG